MSLDSSVVPEDELIERLLERQLSANLTLERLRVRFQGKSVYVVFAPIRSGGCGVCNVVIAEIITPEELSPDYIVPSVFNREVVKLVASAVTHAAVDTGVAGRQRLAAGKDRQ